MEVTQDQLIGIALNALGYLAAGALWMVIYSFFKERKKAGVAVSEPVNLNREPKKASAAASTEREKAAVEFISLSPSDRPSEPRVRTAPAPGPTGQSRRNRAEVIRLAREMLKENVNSEKIKHTLPITEGELAMIKNK